ncbi:MAG: adenine deaminase [Methanospirillaceae archaeon]|nr:adenine deaminase [Methanospirillaceae archaeon]
MRSCISQARGMKKADIAFHNAVLFNPITGSWEETGFAAADGIIIGTGRYRAEKEIDLTGARVIPGLIDSHVHIESSLLSPCEYSRLVSRHGTTTVIADPHEIANTCGTAGIDYMIAASDSLPVDIFFLFPSCVPATPLDESAEVLSRSRMEPYVSHPRVIGLGEMMDVPGILAGDPEVIKKLTLWDTRDGHAPGLTGMDLNAYLCAGIQSDHETTDLAEGREKLQKGMYLYIREGSSEKNLKTLVPLVTPFSVGRTSFCTDDRHADTLREDGHIDDCIRRAVAAGLEPELAIRMGTLSAAERFHLTDRGALLPGRRADFCIMDDCDTFAVKQVYKNGILIQDALFSQKPVSIPHYSFRNTVPSLQDLMIYGEGMARVIKLVPDQITTKAAICPLNSESIPDLSRDILKVVIASRYHEEKIGIGYVSGFSITHGAIASSISHDSHHVIAVGTSDHLIRDAMAEVIRHRGAMTAMIDGKVHTLPLPVAGLMASKPYPEVCGDLAGLSVILEEMGSIPNPFMYLSFLALTVIPEIRITPDGLFDVAKREYIPVFENKTGEPVSDI